MPTTRGPSMAAGATMSGRIGATAGAGPTRPARRLCTARLRDARRACLLLADLLWRRALPCRAVSGLRLGRTYVLRLLPGGLVPSGILWMGLPSLGIADCLGYRGMGLGRSAMVGILWRVVESLSLVCSPILLADGLPDRGAVAVRLCGSHRGECRCDGSGCSSQRREWRRRCGSSRRRRRGGARGADSPGEGSRAEE